MTNFNAIPECLLSDSDRHVKAVLDGISKALPDNVAAIVAVGANAPEGGITVSGLSQFADCRQAVHALYVALASAAGAIARANGKDRQATTLAMIAMLADMAERGDV